MELKLSSYVMAGLITFGLSHTVEAAVIQTASYDNHTYYLLERTDTWKEAEAEANSLGGHLVTINDSEENDWIIDTFQQAALNDLETTSGIPALWTGYIRNRGSSEWYWVSGESSTYTNWASGEPGGSWNEVTSGILLTDHGSGWEAGQWHDILDPRAPQDYDYGLAETVPIPSTILLMCIGLIALASVGRKYR
jgi:hypothetical protein